MRKKLCLIALLGLALAFAKSCKGGDVSVLDPALAWDVCFIYLFNSFCDGVGVCRALALAASLTFGLILAGRSVSHVPRLNLTNSLNLKKSRDFWLVL